MLLTAEICEGGYSEETIVLKDINFSVEPGELVGLIGPNGSGKSSTIKAILGILEHFKGQITIGEYSYIPERPIFYDNLTLREHIDLLFATTANVNEAEFYQRADELLKIFKLEKVIHHYPGSFSKGMQQKGILILAFLRQPDLYIIDEPFMGLDPKAMKKLLQLLEMEKERGAGILMSTHALDTAEKICDRFLLILNGQLLIQGTMENIQQLSGLPNGDLLDCFDVLTEDEEYDQ